MIPDTALISPVLRGGSTFALGGWLRALDVSAFRYTPCFCEENVWRLCEDLLGRRSRSRTQGAVGSSAVPLALRSSSGASRVSPLPSGSKLKVVVISNRSKAVPLWHQRAGRASMLGALGSVAVWQAAYRRPRNLRTQVSAMTAIPRVWTELDTQAPGFVMWDYHVVAVIEDKETGAHVLDLDNTLKPFPLPFDVYAEKALRSGIATRLQAEGRLEGRRFRVIDADEYLDTLCSDRSHMRDAFGRYSAQPPSEEPILNVRPQIADGRTSNLFTEFVNMEPSTGVGEVLSESDFLRRFLT